MADKAMAGFLDSRRQTVLEIGVKLTADPAPTAHPAQAETPSAHPFYTELLPALSNLVPLPSLHFKVLEILHSFLSLCQLYPTTGTTTHCPTLTREL